MAWINVTDQANWTAAGGIWNPVENRWDDVGGGTLTLVANSSILSQPISGIRVGVTQYSSDSLVFLLSAESNLGPISFPTNPNTVALSGDEDVVETTFTEETFNSLQIELLEGSFFYSDWAITTIEVFQSSPPPPTTKYRIFRDIYGNTNFYRRCAQFSTTLADDIDQNETEIQLTNVLPLFNNNLLLVEDFNNDTKKAGVAWIYTAGTPSKTERIEFYAVNLSTNTLIQCRRGTEGTPKLTHEAATAIVEDGSNRQSLLNTEVESESITATGAISTYTFPRITTTDTSNLVVRISGVVETDFTFASTNPLVIAFTFTPIAGSEISVVQNLGFSNSDVNRFPWNQAIQDFLACGGGPPPPGPVAFDFCDPDQWEDYNGTSPPQYWEALNADNRYWFSDSVDVSNVIDYVGTDPLPTGFDIYWEIVNASSGLDVIIEVVFNDIGLPIPIVQDFNVGSSVGNGVITVNPPDPNYDLQVRVITDFGNQLYGNVVALGCA